MEFTLEAATEADGPIPEDTVLLGEVMSAGVKQKKNNTTGETYDRVVIRFQVSDPESPFDGRNVEGETSTKYIAHAECKLYAWSQEIFGQELVEGFKFDTDQLIGHQVRMVIGARHYTTKEGEARTFNFVADVMRTRQAAGAMAAF